MKQSLGDLGVSPSKLKKETRTNQTYQIRA